MLLQAYSIYDRKALQYYPPFFASTDPAAVRMLSDLVNDTNSNVGRHPGDYVLYGVGTYSDQSGSLEPCVPLRHIMDAQALVPIQPPLFGGSFSETKPAVNAAAMNAMRDHLQNGGQ